MARIQFHIEAPALRITIKAILTSAGHEEVQTRPEVIIADSAQRALTYIAECPVLVLAAAAEIPEAVRAMEQGVYGYIFLPLQPGEAELMVRRALAQSSGIRFEDPVMSMEEAETQHIRNTMRQCHNNQAETARRLGIGRNTLWRKLKRMGEVERP